MGDKIVQLRQGLETAFIDKTAVSNLAYKPQFISNNHEEGRKVISSIEDELLSCDEFVISVAFITMGGITPLLQTFKELEKRNIPGKIMTTDYLTFSDPKALRVLNSLKNIELKMYVTENSNEGFHTKGYMFREDNLYRIIIGSSNMTLSALTTNKEWNTKIVSSSQGEFAEAAFSEFNGLWKSENSKSFDEFIDEYTVRYTREKLIRDQKKVAKQAEVPSLEAYKLQPNLMQVEFINSLKKICDLGENRALLISATGAVVII